MFDGLVGMGVWCRRYPGIRYIDSSISVGNICLLIFFLKKNNSMAVATCKNLVRTTTALGGL